MLFRLILLIFLCSTVAAKENFPFAKIKEQADQLIVKGEFFKEQPPQKRCPSSSQLKEKRCHYQKKQNPQDKVFVFVSFSIPEASLKRLAQEARKHHAVLVMRGLYQDSFVKTIQKLQDIGVDINPQLFERYNITSVPTFVAVKEDRVVHRLSGNVSLAFCLEKFQETP